MRWLVFLIFAYLLLGAQVGVGEHFRVMGASPNLVLLGVVFIALNTPREAALTAALLLGLFHDLAASSGPFGLHAVAYGLVGLAATSANREVYTDHPLTHFFASLGGQLIVAVTTAAVLLAQSYVHGSRVPAGAEEGGPIVLGPQVPWATLAGSCLYTAILAPLGLGLLARIKPLFGFEPLRRRIRPY